MLLLNAIEQFLEYRSTYNSPLTVKAYSDRLRVFQRSIPVDSIDGLSPIHIRQFIENLYSIRKYRSVQNSFNAIRQLIKWLAMMDHIEEDWFDNKKYGLKLRPAPNNLKPSVDQEPLVLAIKAAYEAQTLTSREGKHAIRDTAIMMLFFYTGIRRAELLNIKMDDFVINPSHERIDILVSGKALQERYVYATGQAYDAIMHWLEIRTDNCPYLFNKIVQPHLKNGRLNNNTINSMLKRWAKKAGITSLKPHDYRHGFITRAINSDMNMAKLQRLVGHAKITTTQIYYRPRTEDLQEAMVEFNAKIPVIKENLH